MATPRSTARIAASDPSTYSGTFTGRMVAAGAGRFPWKGDLFLDQPVVGEALAPRASRLRGGLWRRLRRRLRRGGTLRWARRRRRSLCPRLGERRAPVPPLVPH